MKIFKTHQRINNFAICGYVDGELLFYKQSFGKFTKDSFVHRYHPGFPQYNDEIHATNTLLELKRTDYRFSKKNKQIRLKFIETARVVKVHIDIDTEMKVEI